MAIQIIKSVNQSQGAFDAGRIQERKPIGFPQDGGQTSAYSTLFYWAHAWSEQGGLIDEHPHRGFEIMSVVLEGEIEHYDSSGRVWKKLLAGDVQVIKAGNGISHAEKILKKSSIFQIWFDPNLAKTLAKPASYMDISSADFPVFENDESKTKVIFGDTKLTLDTDLGYIQDITFKVSEISFSVQDDSIYSFFVLNGSLIIDGETAQKGDYVTIKEENKARFTEMSPETRIFIIKSPLKPSYQTYAEMSFN